MQELLDLIKEFGLGLVMMVYFLFMFNKQNNQKDKSFSKQIDRWEKQEAKLEDKIDRIEASSEKKDLYIRDTLTSLVKETHEYYRHLNNSLKGINDKMDK